MPTMNDALALVESPAQLINAAEWAAASDADVRLVTLGPEPARTRFQMHRVAEICTGAGFDHCWAEVRGPLPTRTVDLARTAARVQAASTLVIGDPYSGIIQMLLAMRSRAPRIVVVDDGTATLRYAEQWAFGGRLQRWHLTEQPRAARLLAPRVAPWLGRRSPHVELFSAMPLTGERPPARRCTYAWTREHFGPPEILDTVDLMGSSLVETGVVQEERYLAGVQRLVAEYGVGRYLPHRAEAAAKVAAIAEMGVEIVRPELPMEWHACRGPIGRHILSFPSTVVHTLPLVLAGTGIEVTAIDVADEWFVTDDASARGFVAGINKNPQDAVAESSSREAGFAVVR
ncbi:hypothetical protein FB460_0205 [Propioniferax innocua]|uniref:Uncharacterized protein n=2 Tax=Propioniferax innocua TaxID=1753 RepID=A0A542ZQE1_9ACTN|nr:hypothetical protein FB460_0205 [Propioniferax innocua]